MVALYSHGRAANLAWPFNQPPTPHCSTNFSMCLHLLPMQQPPSHGTALRTLIADLVAFVKLVLAVVAEPITHYLFPFLGFRPLVYSRRFQPIDLQSGLAQRLGSFWRLRGIHSQPHTRQTHFGRFLIGTVPDFTAGRISFHHSNNAPSLPLQKCCHGQILAATRLSDRKTLPSKDSALI